MESLGELVAMTLWWNHLKSKFFSFLTGHTAFQNVFPNSSLSPFPLCSLFSIVLHCPNVMKFEQKRNKEYSVPQAFGFTFHNKPWKGALPVAWNIKKLLAFWSLKYIHAICSCIHAFKYLLNNPLISGER